MKSKTLTLATALSGLLAAGSVTADPKQEMAKPKGDQVKCFGIAKAGKNDCATAAHGCAGAGKVDNDPKDWKMMPAAECERAGGKAEANDKVQ